MQFFIQAIGIVAMVLNASAYQFKSKRNILLCMFAGSALFAVNMFMLGAIMGGIMNVLGVVRSIAYMKKDSLPFPVKVLNGMFIGAYMVSYVLSFTLIGTEPTARNLILELLPVIGMSVMTLAFSGNNSRIIRRAGLINSPSWLVYNIFNMAIGGILCEMFGIASIISSIIRFDILGKKEDVKQPNAQ